MGSTRPYSLTPRKRRRRRRSSLLALPTQIKIDGATQPVAFNAWLAHLHRAGQTLLADHWRRQGYVYADTEFPPVAEARQR